MKEIWMDIKGYEGYYKISNKGRVKSCTRIINVIRKKNDGSSVAYSLVNRGKIIKSNSGTIHLHRDNVIKVIRINKLTLDAFGKECLLKTNKKDIELYNSAYTDFEKELVLKAPRGGLHDLSEELGRSYAALVTLRNRLRKKM